MVEFGMNGDTGVDEFGLPGLPDINPEAKLWPDYPSISGEY